MNAEQTLNEIRAEISQCRQCALAQNRNRTVPGEGPADTDIMFIGEGPGFHENERGLPFVGQAGKFLDELLQNAGLDRSTVFITNVVKCRPPGNRDPRPEELSACGAFLDRQIATINPKVIVTLGRHSMGKYFTNAKISRIHGQAKWVAGRLIVAMFHPAAALHQPKLRPVIMEDFKNLPNLVEKVKKAEAIQHAGSQDKEINKDEPSQLSFF